MRSLADAAASWLAARSAGATDASGARIRLGSFARPANRVTAAPHDQRAGTETADGVARDEVAECACPDTCLRDHPNE